MRILVLGLGNDIYGDDGVGHHAVRRLKNELGKEDLQGQGSPEIDCVASPLTGIALEAKNIYNLGEGLSEDMERCLPDIVRKIKNVLKDIP
jgi:hypothetical protein